MCRPALEASKRSQTVRSPSTTTINFSYNAIPATFDLYRFVVLVGGISCSELIILSERYQVLMKNGKPPCPPAHQACEGLGSIIESTYVLGTCNPKCPSIGHIPI